MNEQGEIAPRAALVKRIAQELGFALAGIAPAEATEYADFLRQWIADGKHGEMDYLAKNLDVRIDPCEMVQGAKSVICVADRYCSEISNFKSEISDGRIARYAWGDDYHKIIKKRLFELADALRTRFADHEFRCAVDTAPVLEREHAQRAGLGWVGKHTLLINPDAGSWFLLGEIITTLPIENAGDRRETITDHCGTCTRCIDACPTGCITPYQLDASRCISYLTIEHRGMIEPDLHQAMGDWVAGCDVCQEVCPFNSNDSDEIPVHPAPSVPLLELLGWDAEARQRAFTKSALKRIKLEMIKRNALIVAGNVLAKKSDVKRQIESLANDESESELVRATARQVIAGWSGN
jgi:epoxyqueuosine reductase